MKILFQGDSITDAGRDYNDIHNLGYGYPLYSAEEIRNAFPDEEFEFIDRGILERIKKETSAKIIILEQFLIPVPDKEFFHVDLDPKIQITRKLAREYADVFIPLDGLFAAACVGDEPTSFCADGVHPTEKGARFIGKHYLEAFKKLDLIK